MKKYPLFLLFFIACTICASANRQSIELPKQESSLLQTPASLRISILTCASGEDIYTAWGHTAIRVVDSFHHTDLVYNFGTFDFNEPFFLAKFVKGSLEYFISVATYQDFLSEYKYYGRDVKEQVLNLSISEKSKWNVALQNNLVGSNRYYLYNFITDNCTTRVKDGLFQQAEIQPEHIPVRSFRQEIVKAPYLQGIPWVGLGIDLLLGAYSDQQPDHFKSGFLPPLLFEQLQHIKGLVIETNSFQFSPLHATPTQSNEPFIVLILFFIFYVGISKWNAFITQKLARILDISLLCLLGIGGSLVFYMSLISLHTACYENFNLMWLHPLYLLAIPLYFLQKNWIGKLGLIFLSATVGLMFVSHWLPQHFSKEIIVLMTISMFLNFRLIQKGHHAKLV